MGKIKGLILTEVRVFSTPKFSQEKVLLTFDFGLELDNNQSRYFCIVHLLSANLYVSSLILLAVAVSLYNLCELT